MAERIYDPRCLRLVALLKQHQPARLDAYLRQCLEQHSPEWAYLRLLLPAVFFVGEQFVAGELPRSDADLRIAEIKRLMLVARAALRRMPRLNKKIFATFMPGDSHAMGFLAVIDWLDRDGWDILSPWPVPPESQLIAQILRERPAVVAITCSLPRHVVPARRVIRALKQAQLPADIWVGGTAINSVEKLFQRTGGDFTAPDVVAFTRSLAKRYHYLTATPPDIDIATPSEP